MIFSTMKRLYPSFMNKIDDKQELYRHTEMWLAHLREFNAVSVVETIEQLPDLCPGPHAPTLGEFKQLIKRFKVHPAHVMAPLRLEDLSHTTSAVGMKALAEIKKLVEGTSMSNEPPDDFVKPTMEEVLEFMVKHGHPEDWAAPNAKDFFNWYETAKWRLPGGKYLREWETSALRWMSKNPLSMRGADQTSKLPRQLPKSLTRGNDDET